MLRRAFLFSSVILVLAGCGGSSPNSSFRLQTRRNISAWSAQEKADFVQALYAMKSTPSAYDATVSAYDFFVRQHMVAMDGAGMDFGVHNGWQFLPWHREFLRRFEQELARVSGGKVTTLPYWDWTDSRSTDATFGMDFLGGDGDPSDGDLVKTGNLRPDKWQVRFTDLTEGEFGGSGDANDVRGLDRSIGRDVNRLPTASDVAAVYSRPRYDDRPYMGREVDTLVSMRAYLEGGNRGTLGMHNLAHVWVGGDMNSGGSPNDPVFFLHHANIDRLWASYQQRKPDVRIPRELAEQTLWDMPGVKAESVESTQNVGYRYDDLR